MEVNYALDEAITDAAHEAADRLFPEVYQVVLEHGIWCAVKNGIMAGFLAGVDYAKTGQCNDNG